MVVATATETGRIAEDHALDMLQDRGLRLVERNFRTKLGEIDLIMEDGNTLVFIEVRYRKSSRFGSAQESVTRKKQTRLIATASCFLRNRRLDCPTRFDVVALAPSKDGLAMSWIKGAFMASC